MIFCALARLAAVAAAAAVSALELASVVAEVPDVELTEVVAMCIYSIALVVIGSRYENLNHSVQKFEQAQLRNLGKAALGSL
jgi:hypothetical protein